jgi:hypothetical protein
MNERRNDPRWSGPLVRRISALVRPGQWVLVIDLSPAGARVAALRPLRPGAEVDVHLEADGHRTALRATVVRCAVAAMDAEHLIYHAALRFQHRSDWVRERQTRVGSALHDASSIATGGIVHILPSTIVSSEDADLRDEK